MSNNKHKILLIEDRVSIYGLVKKMLITSQYQVFVAENAEQGRFAFRNICPDLILLDMEISDKDGLEFLVELRQESMIPIIVLSERTDEMYKVKALDYGANDYVTKPFGIEELKARIRSALRSHNLILMGGVIQDRFVAGDMEIDFDTRRVLIGGKELKLTKTEYNIVKLLAENKGRVLTYAEIIENIWGCDDEGSTKKLQVNIANIRKKMGAIPGVDKYIQNELGIGYRLNLENELQENK